VAQAGLELAILPSHGTKWERKVGLGVGGVARDPVAGAGGRGSGLELRPGVQKHANAHRGPVCCHLPHLQSGGPQEPILQGHSRAQDRGAGG
jgi:hypothetical protein